MTTGTVLPSTCTVGDLYFNLAGTAGQNFYACTASNVWTLENGSNSGLPDPGANGLVIRTGQNVTSAVAAPASTVVGTSDAQILTNKSIDTSEVTSGTLNSSRIPAVNLAISGNGGVSGNLRIANLNGGSGASSATFWRGDGTWAVPSGVTVPTTPGMVKSTGTALATATPGTDYVRGGVGNLTDAATIATNASQASHFRVILGGNRTLACPTNAADGQKVTWELIQDATGSRSLTLASCFAFGTDVTGVTLTATPNKRDFLGAIYNATTNLWYVVSFAKGY